MGKNIAEYIRRGTCLMGLFDIFYKKPIIKENTFLVWEPCGKSHAEVVPGFVKYLLDLGYHVSVLVSSNAYTEKFLQGLKEINR